VIGPLPCIRIKKVHNLSFKNNKIILISQVVDWLLRVK
jgi:hypothetical protein